MNDMRTIALLFLACLITSSTKDSGQKTAPELPPYYELIKYCMGNFPDNTQVSIALINDSNVTYIGYKKIKDSLYVVDNKDSIFEIASITKIFTACIFADLVHRHVFTLDDSINGILPFPLKQSGLKGKPITFKTLLNHTSGLPWTPDNFIEGEPCNPYAGYSMELFTDYLQHSMHLSSVPGDTFQYSNTALALLGYIMEQKTGIPYEELLQQKVFSKYHMNATSSDWKKITNHTIQGLDPSGFVVPYNYLNSMIPAGGVLSNATDLQKFVRYNFTSDSMLSFLRQQTYQKKEFRMALGWFMFKFGNVGLPCGFTHEGGSYGFRSSMIIDTNDKLGIIVLSNVATYHPKTDIITKLGYELLKREYILQKNSQMASHDAPFIEIALHKGWGTKINDSISHIHDSLNPLVGVWQKRTGERTTTRTFMPDSRVQTDFENDPEIDAWGYYHTNDTTITFKDTGGAACSDDGKYVYRIKKDTLLFEVMNDPCDGRKTGLGGTWIRKK